MLEVFSDLKSDKNDDKKTAESKEEGLIALTALADRAERYEDMCACLKEHILSKSARGETLTDPQMNMLSVCYKNVVGNLRSQWRVLTGEITDGEKGKEELCTKFRDLIAIELQARCDDIISLLSDHLIKVAKAKVEALTEIKTDCPELHQVVFYLKMAGDYYRYICEFIDKENQTNKYEEAKKNAEKYYVDALDEARDHLSKTNPTRLGLALNASVCYYEILAQKDEACKLAKTAFDDAIQKLDTLNDVNYKDSTLIMQLLRDNLTLWTSEANNNEKDEDTED